MTSAGPTIPIKDMSHMYRFGKPVDTSKVRTSVNCNSIADVINRDPSLTKFRYIMRRAGAESLFSQCEEPLTVFVPRDEYISEPSEFYASMDIGSAKEIVNSCVLSRRINGYLVTSSPASYYATKNPENRLFVTNNNGNTILNQRAKVVEFDRDCANGLIHFTTALLFPTDNTYLN